MPSAPNEVPKSYPGRHGDIHHHSTNLFDLDERVIDGGRIDEATGQPYDNSTQTDEKLFSGDQGVQIGYIVDLEDLERQTTGDGEMDDADLWLAQHDV